MRASKILQTASAASHVVPVNQKYTVQSYGIWERIRRAFAVDPTRSNGVPLNAQFRNPAPGALEPQTYDDPVTIPAADIADNPYWKRDVRRAYPQVSVVKQADVVGLLTYGSKAEPKDSLLAGEAGTQQLVQTQQTAEERGLAAHFQEKASSGADVLGTQALAEIAYHCLDAALLFSSVYAGIPYIAMKQVLRDLHLTNSAHLCITTSTKS
ncbi:NADH-ubiquinone oxidoreductase kDa subunit [Microsporum canis CBS 113480]|uniref:NADH-ubiquinone oxidoreductase kDa subunit n=1 Tax=Arthroderma otae (strain ATCC MYA-4605 / CBS 113480) TaxID=554155 RepID=C5FCB3_ARTOC|nr:NADH-ubiquinone oxidoreductase kDa subunit [Microsporum canis CBS 113480]EEQ27357.1 NADH-ubiquinone oxidoreductase kDa subunit [Microsporum canis CBS 113480]